MAAEAALGPPCNQPPATRTRAQKLTPASTEHRARPDPNARACVLRRPGPLNRFGSCNPVSGIYSAARVKGAGPEKNGSKSAEEMALPLSWK